MNLIANTTTTKGLKVQCQLDTNVDPTGVQIPDDDLAVVQLERSDFHGEWNDVIKPHAENKLIPRDALAAAHSGPLAPAGPS